MDSVFLQQCHQTFSGYEGIVILYRLSPVVVCGIGILKKSSVLCFRVWETETWTWDWWSTGSGRCRAACWSPDGRVLLIAMNDEPSIYSLTFANISSESNDLIGGSKTAIPVINLSPVIFDAYGEHLRFVNLDVWILTAVLAVILTLNIF